MTLFLILPLTFAAFIVLTISFCYYRTFKIERYMQSKIRESTVLEIFNMSSIEKYLGLIVRPLPSRKDASRDAVIDRDKSITFLRTNQNDQEWNNAVERNLKQAIEWGFSKISDSNDFEYDNKTESEDFKKFNKYVYAFDIISIKCKNNEIFLSVKNPYGFRYMTSEYYSIKPLINNFNKFKNQFTK